MKKEGYGSIINMSSMASINKSPAISAYASSKAAINHLTKNMAFDFGPDNIRINAIGPGATRTHALSTVLTPDLEKAMLKHTPIKRLGEPEDIAGAVLYFAAPKGPVGYYTYLETVKKQGEHGEAFGYKTVNADALGWIISKVTGKSVAQLLSEKIWSQVGMEQDAYYQVDGLGIPFAGGGLSAGLHDLARFGQLILNMGHWHGKQIIPMAAVADIEKGSSKTAFAKSGHPKLKDWSYRDMWWMTENPDSAFAGRGVHGQTIYIDPKAEMVIVRLASHPIAANSGNEAYSLPAYQAVADYLMHEEH